MTLTPEALEELVERLRGEPTPVDYLAWHETLCGRASEDEQIKTAQLLSRALAANERAASAIAALRKERDEARLPYVNVLRTGVSIVFGPDEIREFVPADSLRAARDLERERCAMLAEMAGQMDLAKQIRSD